MQSINGHELIQAFSAEFSVNLSNFDFERYFRCEGTTPLDALLLLRALGRWVLSLPPDPIRKAPVTLDDLAEAADCGSWSEQPGTSVTV